MFERMICQEGYAARRRSPGDTALLIRGDVSIQDVRLDDPGALCTGVNQGVHEAVVLSIDPHQAIRNERNY